MSYGIFTPLVSRLLPLFSRLSEETETAQPSLWEELKEYFYEKYFNPDLGNYENLDFGTGSLLSIRTIIFGIAIGFVIAGFAIIFDKRVLGDFVRLLLEKEVLSPEKAMTLHELGYGKNTFIRGSLRSGVSLRKVVKCVEEEEFLEKAAAMREEYEKTRKEKGGLPFKEPKFKIDPNTMHFYIPEELKYTADVKFEKKNTNAFVLVLFAVAMVAVVFLAFIYLPDLLQMLDNLITSIKE